MPDGTGSADVDTERFAIAQEVVGLLLELGGRLGQNFTARAAEFGLTVAEAKVLMAVHSGDPQPMRAVARKLGYDASNLTGVVDRLEDRGLLKRRPDIHDRRVKAVVLTEEGEQLASRFLSRLRADAGPLGVLESAELTELRRLLRRTVTEGRT